MPSSSPAGAEPFRCTYTDDSVPAPVLNEPVDNTATDGYLDALESQDFGGVRSLSDSRLASDAEFYDILAGVNDLVDDALLERYWYRSVAIMSEQEDRRFRCVHPPADDGPVRSSQPPLFVPMPLPPPATSPPPSLPPSPPPQPLPFSAYMCTRRRDRSEWPADDITLDGAWLRAVCGGMPPIMVARETLDAIWVLMRLAIRHGDHGPDGGVDPCHLVFRHAFGGSPVGRMISMMFTALRRDYVARRPPPNFHGNTNSRAGPSDQGRGRPHHPRRQPRSPSPQPRRSHEHVSRAPFCSPPPQPCRRWPEQQAGPFSAGRDTTSRRCPSRPAPSTTRDELMASISGERCPWCGAYMRLCSLPCGGVVCSACAHGSCIHRQRNKPAACANPRCACTSSFNGRSGFHCCKTCRDGLPCTENFHPIPSRPACIDPNCACTATFNGLPGNHCCLLCRDGYPCDVNMHPTPYSRRQRNRASTSDDGRHRHPGPQPPTPGGTFSSSNIAYCVRRAMATVPRPLSDSAGLAMTPAVVDTGATSFIVNEVQFLHRVTKRPSNDTVNLLSSTARITAIGDMFISLRTSTGRWRRFEVGDVLVVPGATVTLYSPAAMFEQHGVRHFFDDSLRLVLTSGERVPFDIAPDGGYRIVLGLPKSNIPSQNTSNDVFSDEYNDAPRPRQQCYPAAATHAELEGSVSQATLWRRLAYPHRRSWTHVPTAVADTGLPDGSVARHDLGASDAVMRGRMRALPFHGVTLPSERPPPGAVVYMDFAGPMVPSCIHRFTSYCGVVDAGSGYARAYPCHSQSAEVAKRSLNLFIAELTSRMNLLHTISPQVINADQGSAFISTHFQEFVCEEVGARLRFACTYTPQQNGHVERMWGVTFGTARTLLISARLGPKFHPWAVQTARWIHNRLPSPAYGNKSPFELLSHALPSIKYLRAFGCLIKALVPPSRRSGDHHFADTGMRGVYLGPSEQSDGCVVYVPRRGGEGAIHVTRHVVFYESEFPGVDRPHAWVISDDQPVPQAQSPDAAEHDSESQQTAELEVEDSAGSPCGVDATYDEIATPNAPTVRDSPPDAPPRVVAQLIPNSFDLGAERAAVRHPQAQDPSSVHYERVLPKRTTRNTNPQYAGNDEQAAPRRRRALMATYVDPTMASAGDAVTNFMAHAIRSHTETTPYPHYTYEVSSGGLADRAAYAIVSTTSLGDVAIPGSYKEALNSRHSVYWRAAIDAEIKGLLERGTWRAIPKTSMPADANLMHCHPVFTVKRNADGTIDKFKCRIVANGNTQQHGVDFDRVFSTVVKMATIRVVLAVAAARNYDLSSVDIRQAYLQGDLDSVLYMRMPPGLPRYNKNGVELVCELRKSLYGLKQAGRVWARLLTTFLLNWGFLQSTIDVCLYTYKMGQDIIWLLVWVDDVLICSSGNAIRDRFVDALSKRFPVEDKGELVWILGMRIERDRRARTLQLSQELYVRDLVNKYVDPKLSRRYDSPMDDRIELSVDQCPTDGSAEQHAMQSKRDDYMSIVGGILWLANVTRPELSYCASQLARFVANPGQVHYSAAMRVLLFLDASADSTLTFQPVSASPLTALADSNWSARMSTSGALVYYMDCLVAWFSKVQKSVALSTAEAEYFGAMLAAKELMYLRELLRDLNLTQIGPTCLRIDNKSAIDMAFDAVAFKKTKHIMRAAQYLRDLVSRLYITMEHVNGADNASDILTKAQARAVFCHLFKIMQRRRDSSA